MPINAKNPSVINFTANVIRYSIVSNGSLGTLTLQRCSVDNNQWMDDPTEGSKKQIWIPSEFKNAIDGIYSTLGEINNKVYSKLNIITNLRNKELIVTVFAVATDKTIFSIPNLSTWLQYNQDKAEKVMACWNSLNTVVENYNLTKGI